MGRRDDSVSALLDFEFEHVLVATHRSAMSNHQFQAFLSSGIDGDPRRNYRDEPDRAWTAPDDTTILTSLDSRDLTIQESKSMAQAKDRGVAPSLSRTLRPSSLKANLVASPQSSSPPV